MTGAALPLNADMVIRYEDLKIENSVAELMIDINLLSKNIHAMASDYKKDDVVLKAGTKIKPSTVAILASVGASKVAVYKMPKIAIVSTGDEIVNIDQIPLQHQIRGSNGICLKQLLKSFGHSEVSIHHVVDNEKLMFELFSTLIKSYEVILLTGGVSAGKFDFVPKVLKECNVSEIFHQVAQRPGKPLWFGKTEDDVFVFGLPGNPVSCLVNTRKFVIPFLDRNIKAQRSFLKSKVNFNKNLTYYCLVKVENINGLVVSTPVQGNGSGDFAQLDMADGFVELEPEFAPFEENFIANTYLWSDSHV
jgi:molybdopterin molybdotransferase